MVNLISLPISGTERPSAWRLHGKQTQSHRGKELLGKSRCVPLAFSFITYKWDVHVSLSEKRKSMLALCPSFWAVLFSRELHPSPDFSFFFFPGLSNGHNWNSDDWGFQGYRVIRSLTEQVPALYLVDHCIKSQFINCHLFKCTLQKASLHICSAMSVENPTRGI